MKFRFIALLLLSSLLGSAVHAQVVIASYESPSQRTNSPNLMVKVVNSDYNQSQVVFTWRTGYNAGSYYITSNIRINAYDARGQYLKTCGLTAGAFVNQNRVVGNFQFGAPYTYSSYSYYQSTNSSPSDIVMQFSALPLDTRLVHIEDPTGGFVWNDIYVDLMANHAGSASSSSSNNGSTIGALALGAAIIAGGAALASWLLDDSPSSSSSSSSSSSYSSSSSSSSSTRSSDSFSSLPKPYRSSHKTVNYSSEGIAKLLSRGELYAVRMEDDSNNINTITRAKVKDGSRVILEYYNNTSNPFELEHGYSSRWGSLSLFVRTNGDTWYLMDPDENLIVY